MKIILDWVANHAAWDHVWTLSNPEYFERDTNGNFLPPYDWTDVIQIDHNNTQQQQAMTKAMEFWVRNFDIDGFRADLAHLTPLAFWKNARKQVDSFKKDLIWLAETEEISYHEVFDISYTWNWMHTTEKFFKGETGMDALIRNLQEYQHQFPASSLRLFFTSNHDENSWNGTEYEKYGNHAKMLAVFSCLYTSIPLVYSGQEIPNKKRIQFFEKDPLSWSGELGLHDFYKTLLQCRFSHPALQQNTTGTHVPVKVNGDVISFRRSHGQSELVVVLNFGSEEISNYEPGLSGGKYEDIFTKLVYQSNDRFNIDACGFLALSKIEMP
jgi:alpha-amylase